MTRRLRDISASVKQRLLHVAHERDEEFEQVLVRYVAEPFLYRLSKSTHARAFLLNGAMLFVAWEGMPHRVTRDIDILGFGDDSLERTTTAMREVAATAVEDDGLIFDAESAQAAEVRTPQDCGGDRVSAVATLGKARIRLQVDVGFPAASSAFLTALRVSAPRPAPQRAHNVPRAWSRGPAAKRAANASSFSGPSHRFRPVRRGEWLRSVCHASRDSLQRQLSSRRGVP